MKTVEPFLPYIISLENDIPTAGLFWRSCATTIIRLRYAHLANDDLSVTSQNSIEIHGRDIVFCRLEMNKCVHFLLGRKFNSLCWPVRAVKRHLFVNELANLRGPNRISNHSNNLVIREMRALRLVEDRVTSRYYHLAQGDYSRSVKLQISTSRFVNV